FVELISCRQSELDQLVAKGYTDALVEERRRYCFLVDRQCAVSKHFTLYHVKVKDLVSHKLVSWQNSCSDPCQIPERAMALVKQTATRDTRDTSPEPKPSAKPPGAPSEPAGGSGGSAGPRSIAQVSHPVANGQTQKKRAMEVVPLRVSTSPSPAPNTSCSVPPPPKTNSNTTSTLPTRKTASEHHRDPKSGEHCSLPRAPPSLKLDSSRVRAVFPHEAGDTETLLSFQENDIITLLVPEAKDGWHYGESEVTHQKGWFPYSYTKPLREISTERRTRS
ncbi:BAR/IMD domain-containing adapter protein 2-like, partial [Mustelus asterias]